MATKPVLGIDIGGSGIKGAPVDLTKGDFATERLRIPTPKKSTPENVAEVVKQIVDHFSDTLAKTSPIGVTIPAPSLHGYIPRIANLDKSWKGVNANELFTGVVGRPVVVLNDADAAGLAEAHYGAAKGVEGLVCMTTLGTGIGSALINHGVLIPNTEFGHLEIDGHDAETQAAASVKEELGLSYKKWVPRLVRYYSVVEGLVYPDLFVVGGGVSKDADKFIPKLAEELNTKIVAAELQNRAGIIGAAKFARDGGEA